ncbi:hypothetical protein [Solitalea canadensis]|uniref:Uncharacterized protein n=1 Tax=Solitalea canadensis (strain ATCC 29591 / DSM 3403 / JCM 21819 / LMG 8368 / NBRC 15130 / NCIMB 12057 / USAM 9D) TaxID=929556 RepID=H8KSN2_SOLCM|nr:hypothetical protein [Solitalea canadensis]AFD08583.1 hypothetical protein Solca_3579 [Solitalea canadensis DSM 3403]
MNIYVFGNGNISFDDFKKHYEEVINPYLNNEEVSFLLCDFRGVDTLIMELLKCKTSNVSIYHIGERARYLPDKFNTKVGGWKILGGYENDQERDHEVIKKCTHFIAIDFNSDHKRKSGTAKNMEYCEELGKIRLMK